MISLPKQSKTAELVNRLRAIAHSAEVDDFALARIRSEASQTMDADPAGAHTVMGCIAAIKGLPEEARRHHQIAVQHDAGVQARYNYAVSLALLAENVEALRVATNALERGTRYARVAGPNYHARARQRSIRAGCRPLH